MQTTSPESKLSSEYIGVIFIQIDQHLKVIQKIQRVPDFLEHGVHVNREGLVFGLVVKGHFRKRCGSLGFPRMSGFHSITLHSNFSSILTRFRDIAVFVLQHATFPPQNFSTFPGSRSMIFWLRRAKMLG